MDAASRGEIDDDDSAGPAEPYIPGPDEYLIRNLDAAEEGPVTVDDGLLAHGDSTWDVESLGWKPDDFMLDALVENISREGDEFEDMYI
jgi:hypothetical protein